MEPNIKFIDLFAGLGGFHKGLTNLGEFQCVFASEIDTELQGIYHKNYGIFPEGDITKIDERSIPDHDLLCAGFPCQPFSLAGEKKGYQCPKAGKLIDDILRIVKYHLPKVIMLENVPHILTIENGKFWKAVERSFSKIGYSLKYKIISPEDVGIPQNRKRIFILGCRNKKALESFKWLKNTKTKRNSLSKFLRHSKNSKSLEPAKTKQVKCWQNLLNKCDIRLLPSLSIVAPEFSATYPFDFQHCSLRDMQRYRGAYGKTLKGCKTWNEIMTNLPSYARNSKKVPQWLLQSVKYSRNLYMRENAFIDKWIQTIDKRYNSWQILEWRGYPESLDLSNHILQFRASGIRVSKSERAPSFVAMTPTQVPIVGSEMRYMSQKEMARLQHLHSLPYMLDSEKDTFKALGNAVNAKIVELLARPIKNLIQLHELGRKYS